MEFIRIVLVEFDLEVGQGEFASDKVGFVLK